MQSMVQPKSSYLSLLTAILALTAFALLLAGSGWCNFVKYTSKSDDSISRGFGIWFYESWATVLSSTDTYIVKTCQGYPDSIDLDSSWKAARAFSVLAFILACVILVVKLCVACAPNPDSYSTGIGGRVAPLYLLTAVFQGLTLLFLNSKACTNNPLVQFGSLDWQETCSISAGAKCFISAMVFWFAAAVSSVYEQKAFEDEQRREVVDPDSLTEPLTHNSAA